MERRARREVQLDAAFACLSDASRRHIIELLREAGELRVSDIAEAFSMSLNGVSKHLKTLERAELVEREVRGREHYFRVRWDSLQRPYEWLHFYQHFWASRLDALVDYAATRTDASAGRDEATHEDEDQTHRNKEKKP